MNEVTNLLFYTNFKIKHTVSVVMGTFFLVPGTDTGTGIKRKMVWVLNKCTRYFTGTFRVHPTFIIFLLSPVW